MGVLAHLRNQGLRITADGGRLLVEPRAAITEAIKSTIRVNKGAILRELSAEASDRHTAIQAAGQAARPVLDDFRQALALGRLHVCGNCSRYTFGTDPAGGGTCSLHGDGLLAFLPFDCRDFTGAETPTAPASLHGSSGGAIPMRQHCKH
jgi:hypothetical protein